MQSAVIVIVINTPGYVHRIRQRRSETSLTALAGGRRLAGCLRNSNGADAVITRIRRTGPFHTNSCNVTTHHVIGPFATSAPSSGLRPVRVRTRTSYGSITTFVVIEPCCG